MLLLDYTPNKPVTMHNAAQRLFMLLLQPDIIYNHVVPNCCFLLLPPVQPLIHDSGDLVLDMGRAAFCCVQSTL
jgi:hypothetical protein